MGSWFDLAPAPSRIDRLGEAYQARPEIRAARLAKGQYFTPQTVCDLMLGWALQHASDRVLEPGCGTGAFLIRAYDRLEALGCLSHAQRLAQLTGVELDETAAQLCRTQLESLCAGSESANILTQDFTQPLPACERDYDVVIGNPPYIRNEHRSKSLSPDTALDPLLAEMLCRYDVRARKNPQLFSLGLDTYVLFFLKATALLAPMGRLAFVTSSSWLESSFGHRLQQFLLSHYRVVALIESQCEGWFPEAAIRPVLVWLERQPAGPPSLDTPPAQLIQLTRPLAQLLPPQTSPHYWREVTAWCKSFLSEAPPDGLHRRTVSGETLSTANHTLQSWATYLRTPPILDTLLNESALPWVPLNQLGSVRYPLKTGINRFFYVDRAVIEAFHIEPIYLHPVVKSSKSVQRYCLSGDELDLFLFSCCETMEALAERGHTGAMNYIQWGSHQVAPPRQKRARPTPWPQVTSVQGRAAWYQLPTLPGASILCPRFFDRRYFFARCLEEVLEDQTFYGLTLARELSASLVSAILNSTSVYLMVEASGRTSLGEGVLQFSRQDMALMRVPDLRQLSEPARQELLEAYDALESQPVLSLEETLLQPERQALDLAVSKHLFPHWPALKRQALPDQVAEALIRQSSWRRLGVNRQGRSQGQSEGRPMSR